jgi:CubicO group peptidase (beta-lactamase class C family)
LVGEVVRRVSRRSLGTYLREEITAPLGAEFFVGLPASEESRVARLVSFLESLESGRTLQGLEALGGTVIASDASDSAGLVSTYLAPDGPLFKALAAPGGALSDPGVWDDPRLHAAEVPAANGICDARSLACLYAACVSEVANPAGGSSRILTPEQLDRALLPQTEGPDRVLLGLDIQWGLGFMLNVGIMGSAGFGGPRSFGHFGMGGSVGWADPDLALAMGYVMTQMEIGTTGDARSFRLMKASVEAARRAS